MMHENMLNFPRIAQLRNRRPRLLYPASHPDIKIFLNLFPLVPHPHHLSSPLSFLALSFPLPPSGAEGRLEVNMSELSLEEVERSLLEKDPSVAPGGYWKPKDCLPRWKVCTNNTS